MLLLPSSAKVDTSAAENPSLAAASVPWVRHPSSVVAWADIVAAASVGTAITASVGTSAWGRLDPPCFQT